MVFLLSSPDYLSASQQIEFAHEHKIRLLWILVVQKAGFIVSFEDRRTENRAYFSITDVACVQEPKLESC